MTLDAVVAQADVPYQCSAVSSYQEMHYAVLAFGMFAMARRAANGGLRRLTFRERRERAERGRKPRVRSRSNLSYPQGSRDYGHPSSSFPFARTYASAQDTPQRIPPYRIDSVYSITDPADDTKPENVKRSIIVAGIILGTAALLSYGLWYLLTDHMNTSSQQNTIQKEVPLVLE